MKPNRVTDLMTTTLVVLDPHDSIARARRLLLEHGHSVLPVITRDGRAAGTLSAAQLATRAPDEARTPCHHLMTPAPTMLRPDMSLIEAAAVMSDRRLHYALVVQRQRVVGILAASDFVTATSDGRLAASAPQAPRRTDWRARARGPSLRARTSVAGLEFVDELPA